MNMFSRHLAPYALTVFLVAGSATANAQGNPDFTLVNGTQATILLLQASPTTDNSWGEGRLGRNVVTPGGRFDVRLGAPGVCRWDVRVAYDDRRVEERRDVDLCTTSALTFDGSRAMPIQ
jgi:predicted secreted protein